MNAAEIAEHGLAYLAMVGSTVHGLHLEGQDDRDEMGIAFEPPEALIGLHRFETHVERTQPEGARSGPGDLDRVIYSARKYALLASRGNPTVLLLLFTEPIYQTEIGAEFVRRLRPLVATRAAAPRFIGYLEAQRQKLTGERGGKRVKRPELEAAHGYDTKFAMHAIRLGLQGVEFLRTGRISLPMPEDDRRDLMRVRRGELPFEDALSMIALTSQDLKLAADASRLPAAPDEAAIDALLVEMYQRAWAR